MDPNICSVLAQCYPFNQFSADELQACSDRFEHRHCRRGQAVLRAPQRATDKLTYLVSGAAELRRSFFDRQPLHAGDDLARQPLDNLLTGEGGQIVAVDECDAVLVSREWLDEALSARAERVLATDSTVAAAFQPGDVIEFHRYDVRPLGDPSAAESPEGDWMSRFLQSPLANHLPALNIQRLLACLTEMPLPRGATVIRRGDAGDAMYVLMQGAAAVHTVLDGVFDGREFSLLPGDYFGEESLVASTLRNADVVMTADGAVARLERAAFMDLVYPHLVQTADAAWTRDLLAGEPAGVQLLDVRFTAEARRDPLPGSVRMPISNLRAGFDTLSKDRPCLVAPCGGRRSELAVFLLRQAGFDAYLIGTQLIAT